MWKALTLSECVAQVVAVLCPAAVCCAVPCYNVLCCALLQCAVLCLAAMCCAVLHCKLLNMHSQAAAKLLWWQVQQQSHVMGIMSHKLMLRLSALSGEGPHFIVCQQLLSPGICIAMPGRNSGRLYGSCRLVYGVCYMLYAVCYMISAVLSLQVARALLMWLSHALLVLSFHTASRRRKPRDRLCPQT